MADGDILIVKDDDWLEDGWTSVPNRVMRDKKLSWEARGMFCFLASHASSFIVTIESLMESGNCGRDRTRRMLRELQDAGYLSRSQDQGTDGRYTTPKYHLHCKPRSVPATENPSTGHPSTVEPPSVHPSSENTTPYKKNNSKKTKEQEDQVLSAELALVAASQTMFEVTVVPPITAQTVTAAWIDVQTQKPDGVHPSKAQIGRVSKTAKELLEHNDPARVLAAAISAGDKGHAAIDSELTISSGRSWTRKRETKDDRILAFMNSPT